MSLRAGLGGEVETVVVIGPEGRVALGAFPLARLIARTQTVPAEHVEALREHSVFAFHLEIFFYFINNHNKYMNIIFKYKKVILYLLCIIKVKPFPCPDIVNGPNS